MHYCCICNTGFVPKNISRPAKTCSKACKNALARNITIQQFSDPAAREIQRQKSLKQKKDPEYQQKVKISMKERSIRWGETGHPRSGSKQSDSAKKKISQANLGRFKGKTWEEIYGSDIAKRRRIENSLSMSKKNEILLKNKRSSLEEKVIPYLKGYDNNIQISYYNVDFLNRKTNHIIEIYGDYWHCNPNIYPDDFFHPYFKITAKERRTLDEKRQKYLESLGYTLTVVWESDLNDFIKTMT